MPKGKRKQNNKQGDDGNDSDGCKHLKLSANHLEKIFSSKNIKGCEDCQSGRKKGKQHAKKEARTDDLWVCLTCGAVCCGTSTPQFHARQHYAYYNKHFVVANLKSLEVKCFECAINVKVDDSEQFKDVRQCLNIIKRSRGLEADDEDEETDKKPESNESNEEENQRGNKNNKQNQNNQGKKGKQQQQQGKRGRQNKNDDYELVLADEVAHLEISNDMTSGIKGLRNLGNTCFFNSIMQNLAHTIPLREKLLKLVEPIQTEIMSSNINSKNDNTTKEEKSSSGSETVSTSSSETPNNNTNNNTETKNNNTEISNNNESNNNNTNSQGNASEKTGEEQKNSEENTTNNVDAKELPKVDDTQSEAKNSTEIIVKEEAPKTPAANNNNNESAKNNTATVAQPLEGPLTKEFKSFMRYMWHGKGSVFSPQSLFGQIKKKAPRFSTMRQQDAQELLRYLLDGLSNEERIVFQVETAKREMNSLPNLDKMTKEEQIAVKNMLAKVKPPPSLIEQLFEGQLESTITCHHCGHKSRVIEPVLDLSLSLEPPNKKQSYVEEEVKLNKKQRQRLLREKQLKDKAAEEQKKKQQEEEENKKKQAEQQTNENNAEPMQVEGASAESETKDISNPPADASTAPSEATVESSTNTETTESVKPIDNMTVENGSGSESADTTKVVEESESKAATAEESKGAPKPEESGKAPETAQKEVDTNQEKPNVSAEPGTVEKKEKESTTKEERDKNNNKEVVVKNDWDNLPEDNVPPMLTQIDGRRVREVPTGTSVQSAIYAFTAPELLERDNAFSCYNCTKLHWLKNNTDITPLILAHGDQPEIEEIKKKMELANEQKEITEDKENLDGEPVDQNKSESSDEDEQKDDEDDEEEEKKKVISKKGNNNAKTPAKPKIPLLRRTATKQFLFKKQPEILTLHVKRFMQTHNGFQKLSTFVEFSPVLDLTPYLSETSNEHEKKYKYKLYGIVSHSGGLNSGHYVAYVRNRRVNETLEDARWHYFSDTQFHELRFEEVLRKEAYILFYERFDDTEEKSDL